MPEKIEASWTPAIKEEFERLWRAGMKSAEIGARFGLRQNTTCKIAARLGLPGRGRGWLPSRSVEPRGLSLASPTKKAP